MYYIIYRVNAVHYLKNSKKLSISPQLEQFKDPIIKIPVHTEKTTTKHSKITACNNAHKDG